MKDRAIKSSRRTRNLYGGSRADFFYRRGLQPRGVISHNTHNGRRKVEEILGYNLRIGFAEYYGRYERGGIASTIIEIFPDNTWNRGAEVQEDSDPNVVTEFERLAKELAEKVELKDKLHRADILARIGEFSVLLIGADGELNQPLPNMNSIDEISMLSPYGQDRVKIEEYEDDITNPRFGLPKTYSINFAPIGANDAALAKLKNVTVHWSRVIHVAEVKLDNDVLAIPVLRRGWKYLDDLDKVAGGGAEAAWRRMDPGFLVDADPASMQNDEDEQHLEDEITDYADGESRAIVTFGAKVKPITVGVANFDSNTKTILQLLGGTYRIPMRKLVGNEQGELATNDDTESFTATCAERKAGFGTRLMRQFYDRMTEFGALPRPVSYIVIWPNREELSEEKKADAVSKIAKANKDQADAGESVIMSSDEMRGTYFSLEPFEDSNGESDENDEDSADASGERQFSARALAEDPTVTSLAASLEPAARAAIKGVFAARTVRQAIADFDAGKIARAVNDGLTDAFASKCLGFFTAAAKATQRKAKARKTYLTAAVQGEQPSTRTLATISATFDEKNPRVEKWARENSARLVTEIGAKTEEGIRELIAQSQARGISTPQIRKSLLELVGLRSDQVGALEKFRVRLSVAKPGGNVKVGKLTVKIPKAGVTPAFIERNVAVYAKRLLQQRVTSIARTETLRAANSGQLEMWKQAIDAGELDANVKRVWLVTDDELLRDTHASLDGEETGIDEPFSLGIEPGEEPNCRCGQGLAD